MPKNDRIEIKINTGTAKATITCVDGKLEIRTGAKGLPIYDSRSNRLKGIIGNLLNHTGLALEEAANWNLSEDKLKAQDKYEKDRAKSEKKVQADSLKSNEAHRAKREAEATLGMKEGELEGVTIMEGSGE